MTQSAGDSGRRTAAGLSGLTRMLGVLAVGLVVFGFVVPAQDDGKYRPMSAPAAPVSLVVPSLGIKTPVVPVELTADAALDPPRDPRSVGWWRDSAMPGRDQGQTVIAGHTVHTGGGAMDHIGRLRHGRMVKVVTHEGTMHYRVTRVKVLSKHQLAARASRLFGQSQREGRLVLVTCTDWNGSYYPNNVVVFAHPLGVRTHPHHGGKHKKSHSKDGDAQPRAANPRHE
ncbi:MAG: class F sortase [Nocardioidaceae bacterium]